MFYYLFEDFVIFRFSFFDFTAFHWSFKFNKIFNLAELQNCLFLVNPPYPWDTNK